MSYDRKPLRMSFTNLNNGRSMEAQFNPTQLEEILNVAWSELDVQGGSHQPMQYSKTQNHGFSFSLVFDAYDNSGGQLVTNDPNQLGQERSNGATQNRLADILLARRYLLSLCYGPRGATDVSGTAPPRFLFVWPNFISLTSVIKALRIRHTRFNLRGEPTYFTCDVTISEIRDVRLFSDDVFFDGTSRNMITEAG